MFEPDAARLPPLIDFVNSGGREKFIVEFEGARKDCDITHWGQFTDIKDVEQKSLRASRCTFKKWL